LYKADWRAAVAAVPEPLQADMVNAPEIIYQIRSLYSQLRDYRH
jgi:hypothetical protein